MKYLIFLGGMTIYRAVEVRRKKMTARDALESLVIIGAVYLLIQFIQERLT